MTPEDRGGLSGRSIPACAGEPAWAGWWRPSWWVYPRVCGGTTRADASAGDAFGLSPRVRGNHTYGTAAADTDGSIPACAGEPPRGAPVLPLHRVYPRVCGGTTSSGWGATVSGGLSPRVRGNPNIDGLGNREHGSIPACAGEPSRARRTSTRARVYPRVCGGTSDISGLVVGDTGLSPRVRGNLRGGLGRLLQIGSIPACAGEPAGRDRRISGYRVYPRVCGGTCRARPTTASLQPTAEATDDNAFRAALDLGDTGEPIPPDVQIVESFISPGSLMSCLSGLSPRVRGNPGAGLGGGECLGSIPACAGEPPR